MFSQDGKITIKPNGNQITESYLDADRYLFDFQICKSEDGWISVDIANQAPYLGVWVHPRKLETMQYVEGDIYHTVCVDRQRYVDEVDQLIATYGGLAPSFVTIDPDADSRIDHYVSREIYLPPEDHFGYGHLAKSILGQEFNLRVMNSRAGFYIGTQNNQGEPVSRESVEYWRLSDDAQKALHTGSWTQKWEP